MAVSLKKNNFKSKKFRQKNTINKKSHLKKFLTLVTCLNFLKEYDEIKIVEEKFFKTSCLALHASIPGTQKAIGKI